MLGGNPGSAGAVEGPSRPCAGFLRIFHSQLSDSVLRALSGEIRLGLRRHPVPQRLRPPLDFLPQRNRRIDQLDLDILAGTAEPSLQGLVQNHIAKQEQKHHRQQTERQRSEDELGFDERALAPPVTLQVQLHGGSHQTHQQSDGQDENERGNGPVENCLSGVGGSVFAELERDLPHHQRQQQREQRDAAPENITLTHGYLNYDSKITSAIACFAVWVNDNDMARTPDRKSTRL